VWLPQSQKRKGSHTPPQERGEKGEGTKTLASKGRKNGREGRCYSNAIGEETSCFYHHIWKEKEVSVPDESQGELIGDKRKWACRKGKRPGGGKEKIPNGEQVTSWTGKRGERIRKAPRYDGVEAPPRQGG